MAWGMSEIEDACDEYGICIKFRKDIFVEGVRFKIESDEDRRVFREVMTRLLKKLGEMTGPFLRGWGDKISDVVIPEEFLDHRFVEDFEFWPGRTVEDIESQLVQTAEGVMKIG